MSLLTAAQSFPSLFEEKPSGLASGERPSGFASLRLPAPLVRTLARLDITEPFPIQSATIPDALAGRDVLGRGQTGSGKTLAFGLPLLARTAAGGGRARPRRARPRHPSALVLVPTRELAMQVNDALEKGVDVLVATPGRLGDLIEKGACSLDEIEITVLDEADQMADMGFLPDVTALLERTPAGGQRMLFSATLDADVDVLVQRFLVDPVTHQVDPAAAAVDTMAHHALLIPPQDKFDIIASIAGRRGRTILFVKTQAAVDRLVEQLAAVGVRAGALHGGKTQRVRTRTLAEFREGRMDALVATNVAARGIHVDGVSLVVHVDPPADAKDYLHRAGRTARAGESGTVVTLVLPRQRRSTFTMLERAGVEPVRTHVTAEAPELSELTGARRPSGVPARPRPVTEHRGPRPARGGHHPTERHRTARHPTERHRGQRGQHGQRPGDRRHRPVSDAR